MWIEVIMRILFFQRWFGVRYGGTETHIRELAQRLARKGHEIHILTLKGDCLTGLLPEIKVWTVSKSWGESLFSYETGDPRLLLYTSLFALKAFLKLLAIKLMGVRYDIVSVHFFTEAFLLRIFRWLFHWPYLFFLEGYTDLEAMEARYANLQMANSQTVIDKCYAKWGYKPMLGLVGTDRTRFRPDGDKISFDNKKVVLSVSRLAPQKNLPVLIEAAKLVCEKDANFLFVIVGEGAEKLKLEKMIRKYGLQKNVLLPGAVKIEDLPTYYRSADIFVVTEFPPDETLITIIDAMSSGVPVVATSPTGKFEVLGDSGVIVPLGRSDLLAEKILEVAYDEKFRRELVKKGLKRAERYDWDKLVNEYERACKLVVNSLKKSKHVSG
jgi:glycosyltransferase involved in cell wall biosynthesis